MSHGRKAAGTICPMLPNALLKAGKRHLVKIGRSLPGLNAASVFFRIIGTEFRNNVIRGRIYQLEFNR